MGNNFSTSSWHSMLACALVFNPMRIPSNPGRDPLLKVLSPVPVIPKVRSLLFVTTMSVSRDGSLKMDTLACASSNTMLLPIRWSPVLALLVMC